MSNQVTLTQSESQSLSPANATSRRRSSVTPIEVLTAVFYRVGVNVRVELDERLFKILDEAAHADPERLDAFTWHPVYHDNEVVTNAIRIMDGGGTLVRENASLSYFRCSPRLAGGYGEAAYEALSKAGLAEAINEIATKIADTFKE